jgi:mRNA interferase RelE/StbE
MSNYPKEPDGKAGENRANSVAYSMATDSSDEYRIQFAPSARRQLGELPRPVQQRITSSIDQLAVSPRPRGSIKLEGEDDLYRIRVGKYRIIYAIYDEELIVLVLRVGQRRDVYRG